MNYGELIDNSSFNREILYKNFSDYFNNPVMYKIKDIEDFSMYIAKVNCLLSTFYRYIYVFTQKDNNNNMNQEYLRDLKWYNLQTRTIEDQYNIPLHEYEPTRNTPLYVPINRKEKHPENSVYSCDKLAVEVLLLHEKGGANQYQDKGNLVSAIETYKTIINIID